eukprot:Seg1597.5 transcript_id=Seg1597.5/GoldUCD/mRNA.D3Y31 product="Pre-mRNA-splicing factor 38B" protein_id=Seg1597.5/GoldUCD/D3Y31
MEGEDQSDAARKKKQTNAVQTWGNASTMNINNMVHTNILSSPYFKNTLFTLKTYHEVVDEIYYRVEHLEPWEKGSRKTSGQVGMCGGVRGVGAGGIVSSCFCLLFKLFTLKLTRKQLKGLLDHCDSPYIRGIGFMYIRYCIQPKEIWSWVEEYLEDEEEIDVKAGGGCTMTIGQLIRSFILKLEWYGTLFPRIPVPVEKDIRARLTEINLCDDHKRKADEGWGEAEKHSKSTRDDRGGSRSKDERVFGEAERRSKIQRRSKSPDRSRDRSKRQSPDRNTRRSRSGDRSRGKSDRRSRSRDRHRDRPRRSRSRDRSSRERHEKERGSRNRSKERSEREREHRQGSRDRQDRVRRERDQQDSRRRSKDRERDGRIGVKGSRRSRDRSPRRQERDKERRGNNDRERHRAHERDSKSGGRISLSLRGERKSEHHDENKKSSRKRSRSRSRDKDNHRKSHKEPSEDPYDLTDIVQSVLDDDMEAGELREEETNKETNASKHDEKGIEKEKGARRSVSTERTDEKRKKKHKNKKSKSKSKKKHADSDGET